MLKKAVQFAAILAAGIITGGQYVVTFDYRPTGVSGSFYTEKMQYAIHHIGTPLFAMLIIATLLNLTAAFLNRSDRRTCYLLAAAGICLFAGGLITRFGNIPLLDAIDTWPVSSPPADWLETAERWYAFHSVRFVVGIIGFFLAIASSFTRREDLS